MKSIQRLTPATAVDQIIPLWNQIVDRASSIGLTKRYATVHATTALTLQVINGPGSKDFIEIASPGSRISIRDSNPWQFLETGWSSHATQYLRY